MISTETRQQIGTQYQVETDLPATYDPTSVKIALLKIPHVKSVGFVREGSGENVYIDCVITVDSHADDRFLWKSIENTFFKVIK